MPSSNVSWEIEGSVGTLTFTRPQSRNALTWEMYDALVAACEAVDAAAELRALIVRGSGESFAAGTDISQFRNFRTGSDGVDYERRLDAVIDRIETVTRPTIAAIDGPAIGGGCAIAMACDVRLVTPRARFGVPVARTLGNCLSMANTARLVDLIGPARTRELLLTARLIDANEALAIGLATRIVPAETLDSETRRLALELSERAPSTIAATKALLRRLRAHRTPPDADDIIAECYGSAAFQEGVAAFLDGRPPKWR